MNRHIEVWYDDTSDCENPVYCVSLCDDDGEAACLSTHLQFSDATKAAFAAAKKQGLNVCSRSKDGQLIQIKPNRKDRDR